MTPLRIGLIGAGAIAPAYVQAIGESPECEIRGIADICDDSARAMAQSAHCPAFPSVAKLLSETVCDAAIVCTPPNTHATICRTLLERHIPVLCEKPLCLHVEDAVLLTELAARENVLFTMATKFRFVKDVIEARGMVASGAIGDVLLFENAFTSRVDMSHRWNSDPAASGGGVIVDNGTHSVDLVRYFLGPIKAVQAIVGRRIQDIEVDDSAQMWLQTHDNVIATIDLSWSLNKDLESFIQVYGSKGTIRVGWRTSVFKDASSSTWTAFGSGYDKIQAFRSQIRNFCRAVRGEEDVLVTHADALASVRVIEAAYLSLHQNNWVDVGKSLVPV